ncbi:hypothetical protein AVEN_235449-1 [Araneus ventricosus]|uniref:Uncharacterized protein n=1 Tax=Araneus ventricosus TaxID=182803 RepID=A0A4Y2A4A9_ARAVE|nr:hypothetical protein AVEN_235449-1 [Araneus ventricosus]
MFGERPTIDSLFPLTGRPGHVVRYCRERKLFFDDYRSYNFKRKRLTTISDDQTIRRPTPSLAAISHALQIARHLADPASLPVVELRELERSDLPRRVRPLDENLRRRR